MSEQPVSEPVVKEKPDGQGRPAFADEQYWTWLEFMRPFLEMGNSLYYACNKSGILPHYTVIMEKYRAGGVFSLKIDALRAMPGEMTNNTLVKLVRKISDNVNNDLGLNREDFNVLKLMAEKHRTSQPFFVNRQENAVADESKVGRILDTLEEQSDYDNLASEAQKQMVENDAPVQDKKQMGAADDVQTEHDPAQAPSGAESPPVQ